MWVRSSCRRLITLPHGLRFNATNAAESGSAAATNEIGKFYQDMIFRGREDRLLPIKDLKTLFGLCEAPEHLKYALLGVEYFQKKGQDYSEEISSLFVKTCIKHKDPMIAVNLFLKINRRISAWQTAPSVQRLVESVRSISETAHVTETVNMLGVLVYKGVIINEDTVKLVAKDANIRNDPILNSRMDRIIRKVLKEEVAAKIFAEYPLILSNQAKVTAGKIDSLVPEESPKVEEKAK